MSKIEPYRPTKSIATKCLRLMIEAGDDGIRRTQLRFSLNRPSRDIAATLTRLQAAGLITGKKIKHQGRGRPAEIWWITQKGKEALKELEE